GEKAGGVVASPVGERRSVRTVAQQLPNEGCGRRVKQKRQQPKTVPGREKDKSRVPVTALIAWPRFHAPRAEPQGAKQMAAPAEPRTPNMHRAKRIAPRECGWKHGDSGHSAGEKSCSMKPDKNRLDSDRPSHGRRFRSKSTAKGLSTASLPAPPASPEPAPQSQYQILPAPPPDADDSSATGSASNSDPKESARPAQSPAEFSARCPAA